MRLKILFRLLLIRETSCRPFLSLLLRYVALITLLFLKPLRVLHLSSVGVSQDRVIGVPQLVLSVCKSAAGAVSARFGTFEVLAHGCLVIAVWNLLNSLIWDRIFDGSLLLESVGKKALLL